MKYGTNYFPTLNHAFDYYRPYAGNDTGREVAEKLRDGSIHIGKPKIKEGQTLTIEDNRYHVTEAQ